MAEKIITFTNYSGTYKGEFVPHYNSTFQTVNGVIFNSIGADTLTVYVLYNKYDVTPSAPLATAGGGATKSLAAALVVNKIVPGSIVFTDSQGEIWTDNGHGAMTPHYTGGVLGVTGTIDYLGGQVSLTYASPPGVITVSHAGYQNYRMAKWTVTTPPLATDPSIVILNEPITLMTGEQSLLFTSTLNTASAYVKYTS